jgi:hypothetical protein
LPVLVLATAWFLAAAGLAAQGADPQLIRSAPLGPRDFARGPTLFTRLSSDETGIRADNPYDDPRIWSSLHSEFELGSVGTGVAVGDYDGDGRPDIFVVTKTHGCRLYRNLGHYRFEDVTAKAGVGAAPGIWNQGATFVDIDNRGRLDIYVCRFNAPNLLYINQGDGTFKESAHAYGLDVNDACVMAAFCDYDRDGRLDVFIQTNVLDYAARPNGQHNYLFHHDADGTFTDVTSRAGLSGEAHGHSAVWIDASGSGYPDLYVANDFAQPDVLYHNNRDGTFTNVIDRTIPHMPFSSMGSDLGDVMNDGRLALFTTDMAEPRHEQDQRGMADSRGRTTEDDRHPDLAPQYERNALLLDTGTGRYLEAAQMAGIAATGWTWSPRLEDLDNDGRVDLFVTNGMYREPTNVDLQARQAAAQTPAERIQMIRESPVLAEAHLAFRNLGDLRFEEVGAAWGLDQRGVGFGSALGDLSGDGNLDIVYTSLDGDLTVLRNTENTAHRVNVELRGTRSNRYGIGAVVRIESALGVQARPLVLARGYLSSSEPMAHFGLGADALIRRLTVTWPSGRVQAFEDLPADRRYTITEPAGAPASLPPPPPPAYAEVSGPLGLALASREETVDETAVQRFLPRRLNRRGPALAVGDVAGTGRDALVLGGTTLDPRRVLLPAPGGGFAPAPSLPAESSAVDDGPLLLFDAAGAGHADLLVTRGGNALPDGSPDYQPKLYLNDGHGRFTEAPEGALPPLLIDAGAVAAADFDHSGRLGVFLGGRVVPGQYPATPRSALLANLGGRFQDVTDTLAPALRNVGLVTSALWSDVDGDGWPDLLVAVEWGQVRYFHNAQGKGFEDWTQRAGFAGAGTGWWTSLAAVDLNGDGRPDFVAGNVGLNTPYRADDKYPALLYYGDFSGSGEQPEILEAGYENGTLYPLRTRRDLAAILPSLVHRFPRNDAFARASVADIVGSARLGEAQRWQATELRSGVFLSQPDGTYRFEPLPRIAQIAPLDGMIAGFFGDGGNPGLFALENSYAPVPSVGRFDGGLGQLLDGDNRGHLAAVAPAASGLVVPGDAKAAVIADLDGTGWPTFVVSRNNGTTLAFSPSRDSGRRCLCVRLSGPAGNPCGIGARVTLVLASGRTRSAEVSAGSSLMSQSSPACFFFYRDSDPPRTLRIRWPRGEETQKDVPANAALLSVGP